MKINDNFVNRIFEDEGFRKMMYRVTHPNENDPLFVADQMLDRLRESMAKGKVNKNRTGKEKE